MKKIAIFGTSGTALDVADVCLDMGYEEIVLLSQNKAELLEVNGLIVREEADAEDLFESGYQFAIGISDANIKEKIFLKYVKFDFPNLFHSSVIFGSNQKNAFEGVIGNVVAAGVIFSNSIKVGNFGLYHFRAIIGHDCIIDDFVSIMPGANICGNVTVSKSVLIGVSAVVLQGSPNRKMLICEGATVGANSLVLYQVEKNSTVFGMPAKKILVKRKCND